MKPFIVAFLIFLSALVLSFADVDYYPITSGDKAFFEKIKKAVLADDFDSFAANVAYPTELHFIDAHRIQPRNVHIRTKEKLRNLSRLFFANA